MIYRGLTQRYIVRQELDLVGISVINVAICVCFLRIIIDRLNIVSRFVWIIGILRQLGVLRLFGIVRNLRIGRCNRIVRIHRRFRIGRNYRIDRVNRIVRM